MPHNVIISMVFLRIPWGHGIRKQPVNVATGGLHSFLSFSFHFSFHNDYEIAVKDHVSMSSFYLLPFTATSQHQYYGEREVRLTN